MARDTARDFHLRNSLPRDDAGRDRGVLRAALSKRIAPAVFQVRGFVGGCQLHDA